MNDEGRRRDRTGRDRMEFEGQRICSSTVLVCANEEDWFMHMTDYSPRQWLRSWWRRWWTRRRGRGVVNSVLGCDGTGLKCVSTTRGWMWRTILWATNNDGREIADEVHTDPFCNWVFIYQIKLLYPYLSALLLLLMPPSAHPNNPPTHNNNIRVKLYLNDFSLFGAIRGIVLHILSRFPAHITSWMTAERIDERPLQWTFSPAHYGYGWDRRTAFRKGRSFFGCLGED